MAKTATTWLLIAGAALITVLPLLIGAGSHLEEPFAGADAQGRNAVTNIDRDYEPWFNPIYEAPSTEIESGIFALQAAIGAGIIGYYFGVVRTRAKLAKAAPGTTSADTAVSTADAAQAGPGGRTEQ